MATAPNTIVNTIAIITHAERRRVFLRGFVSVWWKKKDNINILTENYCIGIYTLHIPLCTGGTWDLSDCSSLGWSL